MWRLSVFPPTYCLFGVDKLWGLETEYLKNADMFAPSTSPMLLRIILSWNPQYLPGQQL